MSCPPSNSNFQVRISVYFQGLFSLILLAFPHADDLVQGSFRNAVLTLYAIGIALPATPDRHSSVEVKVVLHGFVNILFISALALISLRPVLRTWRHISVLVGTVGLVFYSSDITIGGISHPQCNEFVGLRMMQIGSKEFPYYVVIWAFSMGMAVLAIPVIALLWLPSRLHTIRRIGLTAAAILWFVTWVMTIVASESSLYTYEFKNLLGFGQIMALVMLFSQVWDIVYYTFKPSKHGGRRIEYWWKNKFKPRYLRTGRRLELGTSSGNGVNGR